MPLNGGQTERFCQIQKEFWAPVDGVPKKHTIESIHEIRFVNDSVYVLVACEWLRDKHYLNRPIVLLKYSKSESGAPILELLGEPGKDDDYFSSFNNKSNPYDYFAIADGYCAFSLSYYIPRDKNKFLVYSLEGKPVLDREVNFVGEVHTDGKRFFCGNHVIFPETGAVKVFSNNGIFAVQTFTKG